MSADVASGVPSEAGSSNERLLNNNHVAATSALESASERKSPEACSDELQLSESEAAEDRLPAHLQVLSGLCSAGPLALPGLNLLNATEYLRNMYAAAAVRNLQQECKRSPGDVIAALPQLAYLSFCGQNPLGSSVAEHTKELLSPPCLSKESSATKVSSASDDKFPCSPVFPSVSVKRQFSNALHNSAAAVKNEAAAAAAEATHDTKRHNSCSQLSPQTPRDSGSVNASSNANADVKTFREQFKQLYEASEDPKRREFLDDLFTFMQKRGTPINRIPIMAKSTLDLYELFRLVVSKGGLVEVINKKLWREITKGLNLPSSITSAAFTLRTQYMKFLYPYECERLKLSTPQELQAAIDGNRREGHSARSSLPSGASASNCASPSGKLGQTCVFTTTMTSNNNDCSSNKSQEDAPEEVCEPFDECSLGESVADEQDFGEVGNANPFDASSCMQQPVSSLMQAILSSQRAGKLPLADDGALAPQRLALSNMQLALPPSPQKRARCAAAAEQADGNKLIKVSVEISGTVYRGVLFKE